MSAFLTVVLGACAPLLLAIALAVRQAGTSKPLNGVDYARVRHPEQLHRWAGNRLLLLPLVSVAGAGISYLVPGAAWLSLCVVIVAILCVATWIALGAERFAREPGA